MKVKFCCDNGANIHSQRSETIDIEKYFGITDEEWLEMTEDQKYKVVEEWAMQLFNFWYEE